MAALADVGPRWTTRCVGEQKIVRPEEQTQQASTCSSAKKTASQRPGPAERSSSDYPANLDLHREYIDDEQRRQQPRPWSRFAAAGARLVWRRPHGFATEDAWNSILHCKAHCHLTKAS